MHDGYALSKNDTFSYDINALNGVLEKEKNAYESLRVWNFHL